MKRPTRFACAIYAGIVPLIIFSFLTTSHIALADGNPDSHSPTFLPQTPPIGSHLIKLTWQDIVRAVDQHPRMAMSNFKVAAARSGVAANKSIPNPTLDSNFAYGHSLEYDNSRFEWGVELSIPLGWIAQRSSKIAAAEAEVDRVKAEGKASRREILMQLRILYWSLIYEQSRVSLLESLAKQTNELCNKVKLRVQKGVARAIEETRVEIENEKLAGELEAALTSLLARKAQLALWLGAPPSTNFFIEGDLSQLPPLTDLPVTKNKLLETHPTLAAAKAKMRSLAAELESERRGRIPEIAIKPFATRELDRQSFGIGLAIDLPILNQKSGRIAQANAEFEASHKLLDAERMDIESMFIEAHTACQNGVELSKRYKDRILPRSVTTNITAERSYYLGESTLFEVIDARRTLLETQRIYLGSLLQAQIDCLRYQTIIGENVP